jgi:hypothetical protein
MPVLFALRDKERVGRIRFVGGFLASSCCTPLIEVCSGCTWSTCNAASVPLAAIAGQRNKHFARCTVIPLPCNFPHQVNSACCIGDAVNVDATGPEATFSALFYFVGHSFASGRMDTNADDGTDTTIKLPVKSSGRYRHRLMTGLYPTGLRRRGGHGSRQENRFYRCK